jgi:hypothetical protein
MRRTEKYFAIPGRRTCLRNCAAFHTAPTLDSTWLAKRVRALFERKMP